MRFALLPVLLLAACASGPAERPPPTVAQSASAEAIHLMEEGRFEDAKRTLGEALARAELLDERDEEAATWNDLGVLERTRGSGADGGGKKRFDAALADHRRALSLYTATGNRKGVATTEQHLGAVLLALGRTESARQHLTAALDSFVREGDATGGAGAKVGLAVLALRDGRPKSALSLADDAASVAKATKDDALLAAALANRASAHRALREFDAARKDLEGALALDRKRESPLAVAADLEGLFGIGRESGDPARAVSYALRAARVLIRLGGAAERARAKELLETVENLAGGQGGLAPEREEAKRLLDALERGEKEARSG